MSIHYGQLSTNKVDLSDIEKRLKALEADNATNKSGIATNKSGIASNKSDVATNKSTISSYNLVILNNTSLIGINKSDISTNKNNITTAYNKAVSNGNKLLRKLRYSQNFEFYYVNPSVGNWSIPGEIPRGHPDKHAPLLNIDAETYIHLQFQKFDTDTDMSGGTEKAEYRISFLDVNSNVTSWTSPVQTLSVSGKKLHSTMYVVDVLCQISVARPTDWQDLRAFSVAYKPIAPSRVSGNETVLFVNVYSKG